LNINLGDIRLQAKEIIKEAGEIIINEKRAALSVQAKSNEFDLVTQLDLKLERFLKEQLSLIIPESKFIAEETDSKIKNDPILWIIDPLDGTTNYVHGLPFFAISVALVINGELQLGFVYNPLLNEFFEAQRGKGAFLNDSRIQVNSIELLPCSLLATGFAYNFRTVEENNFKYFDHFLRKAHGIRRLGSAAIDLCYVARGIFSGYWEWYLSPWDVAAGILVVEEAGGIVSDINGMPYKFGDSSILATNGLIHQAMIEEFSEVRSKY